MKRLKKLSKKGFSLLEMLVVIFIISLLLLLVIPNVNKQRASAEKQANDALVNTIQTQVELYRIDGKGDPTSLSDLHSGGYLSQEQVTRAGKAKISIEDGKVTIPRTNE